MSQPASRICFNEIRKHNLRQDPHPPAPSPDVLLGFYDLIEEHNPQIQRGCALFHPCIGKQVTSSPVLRFAHTTTILEPKEHNWRGGRG